MGEIGKRKAREGGSGQEVMADVSCFLNVCACALCVSVWLTNVYYRVAGNAETMKQCASLIFGFCQLRYVICFSLLRMCLRVWLVDLFSSVFRCAAVPIYSIGQKFLSQSDCESGLVTFGQSCSVGQELERGSWNLSVQS